MKYLFLRCFVVGWHVTVRELLLRQLQANKRHLEMRMKQIIETKPFPFRRMSLSLPRPWASLGIESVAGAIVRLSCWLQAGDACLYQLKPKVRYLCQQSDRSSNARTASSFLPSSAVTQWDLSNICLPRKRLWLWICASCWLLAPLAAKGVFATSHFSSR